MAINSPLPTPQAEPNLSGAQEKGMRSQSSISIKKVLVKTLLFFLLFNFLFAILKPIPLLERLTGYNLLFPGRVRLPFGEIQEKAYNLSLYQLDAMLLSHEIAADKLPDEFRIIVIGDSSVWGYLLKPDQNSHGISQRAGPFHPKWETSEILQPGLSYHYPHKGYLDPQKSL